MLYKGLLLDLRERRTLPYLRGSDVESVPQINQHDRAPSRHRGGDGLVRQRPCLESQVQPTSCASSLNGLYT